MLALVAVDAHQRDRLGRATENDFLTRAKWPGREQVLDIEHCRASEADRGNSRDCARAG